MRTNEGSRDQTDSQQQIEEREWGECDWAALQAARWPVAARIATVWTAAEWVKLARLLRCPLPRLLLLCALSFDTPGGVVDGEVAEFVSFGARQGSSREGVASGTLWVDGAHSELIAACLLGSEFTGQQFRRASVTATQMLLVTTALPWLRSSSMVICRHLVSR